MTKLAYLEDFSDLVVPASSESVAPVTPADDTVGDYDQGYEAGWNDAMAAEKSSNDQAVRDMALALQETGFTYFEARQHVLNSLRPVLTEICNKILPELAHQSLAPRIIETIQDLASSIEAPIEILCAPSAKEMLDELCATQIKFPVNVSTEPSLTDQQILFRYDDGTTELNLSQCIDTIQRSVSGFFNGLEQRKVENA